jgi:hypothetical protein
LTFQKRGDVHHSSSDFRMTMRDYYLRLLRGSTPEAARKAWSSASTWVTLAVAGIAGWNPEIAEQLNATWKTRSRWWAIVPIVAWLVWRLVRNNHREVSSLLTELSQYKSSDVKPTITLKDEGELIYVSIVNEGAAGTFSATMRFTGTAEEPPKKKLYARWDADVDAKSKEIPRGSEERIRLAQRIKEGPAESYDVFWKSDQTRVRTHRSPICIKGTPSTHGWCVQVFITLVVRPDNGRRPLLVTVTLPAIGEPSLTVQST